MNVFRRRKDDAYDKRTFYIIYIASFLNAFHLGLPLYIESSYLKEVFTQLFAEPDKYIGLVYSAAFFITFIIFINIAKILRAFTNYRLAFTLVALEVIALLGLAFLQNPIWNILLFVVHLIVAGMIYFSLDLFLESFSNDSDTGSIRGMYLTIMSTAMLMAPFIGGLILTDGDFWKLFLGSSVLIAPILLFLYIRFRDFAEPDYEDVSFIQGIKEIMKLKDIRNIMYASFLLRLFYTWMVIYTPIYLNQHIGLDFSVIVGIVMPIALLPFILLEFVLGKIADTKLGEKEMLITGFIITAITVAIIPFVESTNALVWAAVLFGTRVGASFIESMSETYFFKKIDATDAYLIGYFRNLRPVAYITGPLIASAALFFLPFEYTFLVLAGIMLTGIFSAAAIKDTL
jgi:MFS family permease